MTKQSELELYKKALIDWEKPIEEAGKNDTQFGFCWYFDECDNNFEFEGWIYDSFSIELPTLFNQRLTSDINYHYKFEGSTEIGRQQRVTALKNAIEILEKELKQEV